jgi:tetratricopeptide (TPR) repeat protein
VAADLNNLAMILQDLGDAAGAKPLAERALRLDEASYGPDHTVVATALNNLATILRDLGDVAGAKPLAERALRIAESSYGPDHPVVAIRLNNRLRSCRIWRTWPGRNSWRSARCGSRRTPTGPTIPR